MSDGRLDYSGFEDLDARARLGARRAQHLHDAHRHDEDRGRRRRRRHHGRGEQRRPDDRRPGRATTSSSSTRSASPASRRVIGKVFDRRRPRLRHDHRSACSATAPPVCGRSTPRSTAARNTLIVNGTADADTFLLRRGLIALMNTPRPERHVRAAPSASPTTTGINAGVVVNAGAGDDQVALRRHLERRDGQRRGRQRPLPGRPDRRRRTVPARRVIGGPMFELGQVVDHVGTTYGRLTARRLALGHDQRRPRQRPLLRLPQQGRPAAQRRRRRRHVHHPHVLLDRRADQRQRRRRAATSSSTSPTRRSTSTAATASTRVVVIGTEADDISWSPPTASSAPGASSAFIGVEQLDVDGAEGDDRFYVLSTKAGVADADLRRPRQRHRLRRGRRARRRRRQRPARPQRPDRARGDRPGRLGRHRRSTASPPRSSTTTSPRS